MIHSIRDKIPRVPASAFVAWNCELAGEVDVGEDASLWFGSSIRADIAPIRIGRGTNIQDGAVIHVDHDVPCSIGADCTVGHGAILHSCEIGDGCLIGMGAIVLSGAKIGPGSLVGAGALVTQDKEFPSGSLIVGNPGRSLRKLGPEDQAEILKSAAGYVLLGRQAAAEYVEIPRP
jgi:carbonic anhydrase/acetyltransferase-like protein (isoleucine patch superfamily)